MLNMDSDSAALLPQSDVGYGSVEIEADQRKGRNRLYSAIVFVGVVVAVVSAAIAIHHLVSQSSSLAPQDTELAGIQEIDHDDAVQHDDAVHHDDAVQHDDKIKHDDTASQTVSIISQDLFEVNSLIFGVHIRSKQAESLYIEYWRSDKQGPRLRSLSSERGIEHTIHMFRLHEQTQYLYEVFVENRKFDESVTGDFMTGKIPDILSNLDLTVVQGQATYGLSLTTNPLMDGIGPDKPQTAYIFDENGKIVWYIVLYHPLDKFDGFGFDRTAGSYNIISQGTDRMQMWSPLGELVTETLFYCPLLHHEGSFDYSDTRYAFTLGSRAEYVEGLDNDQLQDVVVRWDIEDGKLDEVIYFMDHLDIVKDRTDASDVPVFLFWEQCDAHANYTKTGNTPDNWSHVNSVRRSLSGDDLVICSLKALDKVVAFTSDLSEVAWTVNGHGTDFTFSNQDDRFYHPHDAQIIANGNILLMDNGNVRPKNYGGSYSRALELKLDHKNKIVKKVWDFALELDGELCESPNGGGAQRLDSGNTLVQLASCSGEGSPTGLVSHTVEVSQKGDILFHVSITVNDLPTYRVLPQTSVAGETVVESK